MASDEPASCRRPSSPIGPFVAREAVHALNLRARVRFCWLSYRSVAEAFLAAHALYQFQKKWLQEPRNGIADSPCIPVVAIQDGEDQPILSLEGIAAGSNRVLRKTASLLELFGNDLVIERCADRLLQEGRGQAEPPHEQAIGKGWVGVRTQRPGLEGTDLIDKTRQPDEPCQSFSTAAGGMLSEIHGVTPCFAQCDHSTGLEARETAEQNDQFQPTLCSEAL